MKVVIFGASGMVGQGVLRECLLDPELGGLDACFFCLGVSSAGMNEASYTRVTYDYAMAAAKALLAASPGLTFVFVSGAGTDGTEKGRSMWARVKGKTENALLAMPFKAAYMFRPAMIQPLHGIKSKTGLYRAAYAVMGPTYPMWKALFPKYVTTTERVGRAMLHVAKHGADKRVLENADLDALGG